MGTGSFEPNFRKSSYSDRSDRVEVAEPGGDDTAVRDSRNPDAGHLSLPSPAWSALLGAVARG
ncbi:DUF397 domain-containing protein [Nocardiopsis sp. CC223A]|uniref:DUF397 domain-containing protein n=1 Tax=Nocardiopsis sp. CC223A TaxID=3044051 RepID=UPI00278BDBA4|nr:DUF397 domain-containing protein [Nocardiopsis sp. CC223A]